MLWARRDETGVSGVYRHPRPGLNRLYGLSVKGTVGKLKEKMGDLIVIAIVVSCVAASIFASFALIAIPPRLEKPRIKASALDATATIQKLIEKNKPTTESLAPFIRNEVEKIIHEDDQTSRQFRRRVQVSRGGDFINRIDRFVAGTPLEGHGRTFYVASLDNGLPWNLSVAIARRESHLGRAIPTGSYNAWGMTAGTVPGYSAVAARGSDGTRPYEAFPDWDTGIIEHASYIRRTWGPVQSARQMRGYAMDKNWANGVEAVRLEI